MPAYSRPPGRLKTKKCLMGGPVIFPRRKLRSIVLS
jgi:hypothetical protein